MPSKVWDEITCTFRFWHETFSYAVSCFSCLENLEPTLNIIDIVWDPIKMTAVFLSVMVYQQAIGWNSDGIEENFNM